MATETELERMIVRLIGDATSFQKMLSDSIASTNKAVGAIEQSSKKVESFGKSLQGFATAASAALAGITAGFNITRAFADFDQAIVQSTAIMEVNQSQMRRMAETAKSVSSSGATSATDLGKAFYYLASAGFDAEQSIAALPAVTAFATAGMFNLSRATDLATDAQSALGMKSANADKNLKLLTRTTDVLVRANTLANASVEQFSVALTSRAGSALKAMNKDVEEGVAVLAAFADQGIKGELAGGNLARVMLLLSKSARENAEQHRMLGFSVFDSSGKMRNFADIVQDLERILDGMTDETKSAALEMLGFESRIQQAVLPLLGTSEAIRKYEKELRSATGYTDKVAKKQMESLSSKMSQLKNQFTLVAIEIGQAVAPALKLLVDGITEIIRWWNSLSKETKQVTVAIGLLVTVVAGIGPVVAGVKLLVTAFLALAGPIKAAYVAILAFKFGSFIAGIGAATKGILAFVAASVTLAGAMKAIAVIAIATTLYEIGKGAFHAIAGTEKLNQELEKTAKLNDRMTQRQRRQTQQIIQEVTTIEDPGRRKQAIQEQMDMARKEVEGLTKFISSEQKRIEEESSGLLTSLGKMVVPKGVHEADAASLKQAEGSLKNFQDRLQQLQDEFKKLADVESIEKITLDIFNMETKLKEQIDTLGLSGSELEIYKMQIAGATEEQLAFIYALTDTIEQLKEEQKVAEDVKALTSNLEEQIETFGMTSREADIYRLALRGASDEQLEAAKNMSLVLDALEEQEKLFDKGADVTKEFLTPIEKFVEREAELNELLDAGAISFETYQRAIEAARKDLQGAKQDVERFDAAAAGSAEALARISAYTDRFTDSTRPTSTQQQVDMAAHNIQQRMNTIAANVQGRVDNVTNVKNAPNVQVNAKDNQANWPELLRILRAMYDRMGDGSGPDIDISIIDFDV